MKKTLTLLLLICLMGIGPSFASLDQVTIIIEGQEIIFDEDSGFPYIDENGRTQVPFRRALEAFGAEVGWESETSMAIATYGDIQVKAPIGKMYIQKDHSYFSIDSSAVLKNSRTYLPIRAVFEGFGAKVGWNDESQSVEIIKNGLVEPTFTEMSSFELGMPKESLLAQHGQPKEILASKYNFDWWLYYNDNYQSYYQVGVQDDQMVAIYTPSVLEGWPYDISINMSKVEATEQIEKLKTTQSAYRYSLNYDTFNKNQVSAIFICDSKYKGPNPTLNFEDPKEVLISSFERQVFHITNAYRGKFNKTPLKWDDSLASTAKAHSNDMADNNYFSHTNLKNESPFDRMKKDGIQYRQASENIAAGQKSPIFVLDVWMNSEGHRKNILDTTSYLGVGIGYNKSSPYKIYYTQKFITPMN
jgi:uncharacterized protein YkwD